MINIVFYDKETGTILASSQTHQAHAEKDKRDYIVVPVYDYRYDVTHMVVDGKLVKKP
jgi:hypothetical protein